MEKKEAAFALTHLMNGNGWRSQTEMLKLISSHFNRYPLIQLQDVYKLLYQGTMGIDHYFQSSQAFEERLMQEMEKIQADGSLPFWEAIRPDGRIVRLNLAACKAKSCEIAALATLCYWTSNIFNGNLDDLKTAWDTFLRLCRAHRVQKFPLDKVEQFTHQIEKNKYLPMHHSDIYQQTYQPAYRLIGREFLGVLPGFSETDIT